MSTTQDIDLSTAGDDIRDLADPENAANMTRTKAERIHHALTTAWGMPELPISRSGEMGVPISAVRRKFANEPETVKERYGTKYPFVAASVVGQEYERDSTEADAATTRAVESLHESVDPDSQRALVDEGVIGAAAPIEVDPVLFNVLNNEVPELNIIEQIAQPGFQFQYNVISDRDTPIGMLSESEAAGDLESSFTPQSFTLSDETLSMKRQVGLFKVSDFSQRAMTTLDYMDPRETTLGQGTIAHQNRCTTATPRSVLATSPSRTATPTTASPRSPTTPATPSTSPASPRASSKTCSTN